MREPAPAEALGSSLAGISERRLLVALALVQFVNVLDFMMVMPLGPDFVQALGIPSSRLGLVAGSYTASAAVSGLVGMLFLDRFDRKKALVVALTGLAFGTLAGGLATGLGSLMVARVLAGAFGGPATALGLAIIADVIPPARRGQALGAVMGAFSVASVLGVPAGLELARLGGWRVPFFAVGGLCGAVALGTALSLPSLTLHLRAAERAPPAGALDVIRRPVVLIAMGASWVTMLSVFMIVPNITSYLQFNLGYPRAQLGMLYLVGGVLSFFTMRVAGRVADRFGTSLVVTFGTFLFIAATVAGFVFPHALLPIMVVFTLFMISGSFRMVPMNALATRVPLATERARYMSIQSTVQHIGAAMGAAGSTYLLVEQPGGRLAGMRNVALGSIALALLLPLLIGAVERRVRAAAG